MKYEEMSSILNTSVGALKASYHHAVKKYAIFLNHKIKPFESGNIKYTKKGMPVMKEEDFIRKNTVPATRSRFRRGISSSLRPS